MKHLLHSYWGNKYQIQSSLIAPRNGNTVKQFFIKIKFSTTKPSLDNLSNKMKNILDVYHYDLYILKDRTIDWTAINCNDALDVLIVKVRLLLQVIFRALWDECLLLISCLQLNDNRFCPIMKQLDAIVIQNIAACFCEASIRIYQKGCSWSFKFSLENYLEIWCSIIKPKKEPGNYRLELAIESWCWWWPSRPPSLHLPL